MTIETYVVRSTSAFDSTIHCEEHLNRSNGYIVYSYTGFNFNSISIQFQL